jgi:hypothetical protein
VGATGHALPRHVTGDSAISSEALQLALQSDPARLAEALSMLPADVKAALMLAMRGTTTPCGAPSNRSIR